MLKDIELSNQINIIHTHWLPEDLTGNKCKESSYIQFDLHQRDQMKTVLFATSIISKSQKKITVNSYNALSPERKQHDNSESRKSLKYIY